MIVTFMNVTQIGDVRECNDVTFMNVTQVGDVRELLQHTEVEES